MKKTYAYTKKGRADKRYKIAKEVYKERPFEWRVFWIGFTVGVILTALVSLAGQWRYHNRFVVLYPVEKMSLSPDTLGMIAFGASNEKIPTVCDKPYGDLFCAYDWDPKVMYAIATCESRLSPTAWNINYDGSVDVGLLQINSVHGHDPYALEDPRTNIERGYEVYQSQGLGAWYAYQNECYYRELDQL